MVDIRNRRRRGKGKSRVSFLADEFAILMSLCCGNSHCTDRRAGCTTIFWKVKIFATYKREVLFYFVISVLSGGNLRAYCTTTSTFMATKLLWEPLFYSNVPLWLLFSFAFKIGKWCWNKSRWSALWTKATSCFHRTCSCVQDFALTVRYRSLSFQFCEVFVSII